MSDAHVKGFQQGRTQTLAEVREKLELLSLNIMNVVTKEIISTLDELENNSQLNSTLKGDTFPISAEKVANKKSPTDTSNLCKNCGHSELVHHRRKLGKCVFEGCRCKKYEENSEGKR